MTIRIEITDVTKEDSKALVNLAKYLLECAGHAMVEVAAPVHTVGKTTLPFRPEIPTKKKKTTADIGKEMVQEHENIMRDAVNEMQEKNKPSGGYEHCASPIPVPPNEPINFNTFMVKITGLCSTGKIRDIDILNIVRSHGLTKTHDLQSNPEILAKVNADLDKFIGDMK